MGFYYKDKKINILDTPGHQFAEDTYRTLTACDSVIVVIDVAKGVEPQTEKLVQVCRMRATPIIVFINKLNAKRDGFDLIDEVEQKLGLTYVPYPGPSEWDTSHGCIKGTSTYTALRTTKISEGTSFEDISSLNLTNM